MSKSKQAVAPDLPPSPRLMAALLAASAVLAVVHLPLLYAGSLRLAAIAKVGSIVLLLSYAERPTTPRSLLAALAFSALGDLFLGVNGIARIEPALLFLAGLFSFLLAHFCYIRLFATHTERLSRASFRRVGMALVGAILISVLGVLWPTLGGMRWPVVIYSVVLGAMAISAQRSKFPGITAIGALLFVASDAMLAYARFHQIFYAAAVLIWFSYYLAQVLICVGVVRFVKAKN
ncbi:MAG TPA: lysoplasmalogenase [Candidatus Acidoferrales bacterium]|nr:lysoplasmalogenase [Candidatus Acidoferrales bacterium]